MSARGASTCGLGQTSERQARLHRLVRRHSRAGRSYVSDGYAHAVEFHVDRHPPRRRRREAGPAGQSAQSRPRSPSPPKRRWPSPTAASRRRPASSVVGDTVELHGPRHDEMLSGGQRLVEIVVNGQPVAEQEIPADGKIARPDVRRAHRPAAVGSPCGTFRSCTPTPSTSSSPTSRSAQRRQRPVVHRRDRPALEEPREEYQAD